ncbi:hypothetical protein D3C75_203670 [compost metagenome]
MFKRFIAIILLVFVFVCSSVYADAVQKNVSLLDDYNITVNYKDYDGIVKSVSIVDDVLSVNNNIMISIDSLDLLNMEADRFLFIATYARALEYIILDPGLETNKIGLYINKKSYILKDPDYEDIKMGTMKESPVEYNGIAYIPIDVFNLMDLKATNNENNITIDIAGDPNIKTVVTGIDRKKEVLTVKRGDQQIKLKLIGVDIPNDDKTYNATVSKVVYALKGKEISIKYDLSPTAISYDVEGGYYYVYAYLPGDDISLNEQILSMGYASYIDYEVGTDLREELINSAKYAQSNKLGVYKINSTKIYKVESVNNKIVTLSQGGTVYQIDFGDKNLSYTLKQYSPSSLKKLNDYVGKNIELKVRPVDNYDFVLYIITYLKEKK